MAFRITLVKGRKDFLSGQEGAWPTSLVRPLRKSKFRPEERTKGVRSSSLKRAKRGGENVGKSDDNPGRNEKA